MGPGVPARKPMAVFLLTVLLLQPVSVLREQAVKLFEQGKYAEAASVMDKALAQQEKITGAESIEAASCRNDLGMYYRAAGNYEAAERELQKALEIRRQKLDPQDITVAESLNNLGLLYRDLGRYAEAEKLFQQSLKIRELILPADHPDLATTLNGLAVVYDATGRYSLAEPLYLRALEIRKKSLGPNHPKVAIACNNLAILYSSLGRYKEAEELHKQALTIQEQSEGPDHPDVAMTLNNLAAVYTETGRGKEAIELQRRALAIWKATLGPEHSRVAVVLNNLGTHLTDEGRYEEAEQYLREAVEIWRKTTGSRHPDTATAYMNLALLYMKTKKYQEAENLCRQALEIYEENYGSENPDVAYSLQTLGYLYSITEHEDKAEPVLSRALAIREKILPDHPSVAESRIQLANAIDLKQPLKAHALLEEAVTLQAKIRQSVFPLLSDRQKLLFWQSQKEGIDSLLSQTGRLLAADEAAVADAFGAWIAWKGSVQESQQFSRETLAKSLSPDVQEIGKQIHEVEVELSHMWFQDPGDSEEYRARVADLIRKKEELEARLSSLTVQHAKPAQEPGIAAIQQVISAGSIYVDFALVVFPENKAHYLAFVLSPGAKPALSLLDLGDAEAVEKNASGFVQAIRQKSPLRVTQRYARLLYRELISPVEKLLNGKKRILISADGMLHMIPMEALQSEDGKYLLDSFEIAYVGSGRDMLLWDQPPANGESLIFADPDFDFGVKRRGEVPDLSAELLPELRKMHFSRLVGAEEEGKRVLQILKENLHISAKLYLGQDATQEALLQVRSPRVLHLATHGYFLPAATGPIWENPLMRSGIVLSRANASLEDGKEEGIISAEKLLGIQLQGTDLVVLSACNTGMGDVYPGEGVFGLKRSFILAGARSLVVSLWQVSDQITLPLMNDFYTKWTEGATKVAALRQARLNIKANHPEPYYWASFLLFGSPE